jgi:hypothetical protein
MLAILGILYSVTVNEVDQLEFEWQDYDRFKGTFRVDPTQGVYKVKFPVTEAARKSASQLQWILLNFLQLKLYHRARKVR